MKIIEFVHTNCTIVNLVFANYALIFGLEVAVISTENQVILHPCEKRYTVKGYPFYLVLAAILDYCPQEQLFFPYLF